MWNVLRKAWVSVCCLVVSIKILLTLVKLYIRYQIPTRVFAASSSTVRPYWRAKQAAANRSTHSLHAPAIELREKREDCEVSRLTVYNVTAEDCVTIHIRVRIVTVHIRVRINE